MSAYRTNRVVQFAWRSTDDQPGTGRFVGKTYTDSGRAFEVGDPEVVRVLEYALDPRSRDEIAGFVEREFDADPDEARDVVDSLVEQEFLLPADHPLFDRTEEWFEKNWRRALYYHLGSRNVSYADDDPDDRKRTREDVIGSYLAEEDAPPVYPSFDDDELVSLPEPEPMPDRPLAETLLARRTTRGFAGESLSATRLSSLLYHVFDPVREVRDFVARHADEEPVLHHVSLQLPFEVYPLVMRVDGFDPGLYAYSIRDHALVPRASFDDAEEIEALLADLSHQPYSQGGAVTCLFSAHVHRERWRYRHDRALRNLYAKTTTHPHRLILVATAYGLGAFQTPALKDSEIDDLVGTDSFEEPISYLVTVGEK